MQRARVLEHMSGTGLLRCYVDRTCTSRNAYMVPIHSMKTKGSVAGRNGIAAPDAFFMAAGCRLEVQKIHSFV